MQGFCDWLAATALSQFFANQGWFVPTVQTLHILSIAVVVITLGMLDFRLLHFTQRGPAPEAMAGKFIPWTWRALVVLLLTGILLIITEPTRELMNNAFRLKMLMVVVLVVLTIAVQRASAREPGYWNASPGRRRLGGALGMASLVLCVAIVAAGRLIAYL
jgi:uncharacterized membrane protein SirB2